MKIFSIDVKINLCIQINGGEKILQMPLTEIETRVIKTCCELNDRLTLNTIENEKRFVYKSRFLAVNFDRGFMIIDEPFADTPNARPLSIGQLLEIFFEYRIFRYLFSSKVLEYTKYQMQDQHINALKILLPNQLQDGDKREYFRLESGMTPVVVKFNIFSRAVDTKMVQNTPEEFEGEMVDISGGGFSMKGKMGKKSFPMEKGNVICARFALKPGEEIWEIWCEVRNTRKYKDTQITVWGMQFLGKERNRNLNYYRNKILRYVTERQREILSK